MCFLSTQGQVNRVAEFQSHSKFYACLVSAFDLVLIKKSCFVQDNIYGISTAYSKKLWSDWPKSGP